MSTPPIKTPAASSAPPSPSLPPQPRAVAAGRAVAWWSEAWALFMRAPGIWILMLLATIVAAFVVAVVPLLGWLAVSLLGPVVGGSLMLAARKVDGGGALDFVVLAAGFRDRFAPLLILGAVELGVAFAIGPVAGIARVGFGLGALFFLVIFVIAIAIDAIRQSFSGCLTNIVVPIVFATLYLVAAIVASIPFGLGWIVLMPVLVLTMYTSYKDVFGA